MPTDGGADVFGLAGFFRNDDLIDHSNTNERGQADGRSSRREEREVLEHLHVAHGLAVELRGVTRVDDVVDEQAIGAAACGRPGGRWPRRCA